MEQQQNGGGNQFKTVGGSWNNFQNSPYLLPLTDRSLVKIFEMHIKLELMPYPFQTETSTAK